jgi:hypothetical protein
VSSVQLDVHDPETHWNGSQFVPELVTHVPEPLHVEPLTIVPLHVLTPHDAPFG